MDPRFKIEDSRSKNRAVRHQLPTESHRRREHDHMLCFFLRCMLSIRSLPDKNKPDSCNARSQNRLSSKRRFGNSLSTPREKPRKQRHTHVKYNALADPERQVVPVAGVGWKQTALDLPAWGRLGEQFVSMFDVPWTSGKQSSITNLTPNNTTGGRQHANETEMLRA